MVGVAQLVSASDCGSEGRGFDSHHPPLLTTVLVLYEIYYFGSLAQLVEHWTFNPGVSGSSPE